MLFARMLCGLMLLPCLISAVLGDAAAYDEDFEAKWRPERWSFSKGPEFPGAEGSLERSPQAAHTGQFGGRLAFDFHGGGNYVAAVVQLENAPALSAVRLWLNMPEGHGLTLRYTDQTGQTLQKPVWAPGGRWVEALVPFDEWSGHWGGADDGQIHGPPKSIAILMERGVDESGVLLFDDVRFVEGEAARAAATVVTEYQVFGFGEGEQWALRADGDAGASSLSGTRWSLDFSRGATAIGITPREVSLLGNPLEIRIRARGNAAGHPVRLLIATHFMTFEKTIGEFNGDGLHEIVVAAPPGDGWRWYGGENDGKRHGPLRIRGLYVDANGRADAPQLELVDVRVKTSCAANRCCVLTAGYEDDGNQRAFVATVRSLAPGALAGTLTHTIRDWSGSVVASGVTSLTVPAAGAAQRTVVPCPETGQSLLEAEFVLEAPDQLVPAAQAYFTSAPDTVVDNVLRPASPFGMGLYLYRYGSDPASLAAMDRAARLGAAAGVKWSREEISWGRVEVAPGKYDWTFYDQVVATARKHGISVYGLLAYWSRWTKPYTSEGIADYCRFAQAAAEHFRNDIQYWEVYNEPNIFFWQGPRDMYAELLTKAYAAIREANPQAQVLGCSTAGIDLPFIRRTIELGAPFDILTIHPYREQLADRRFIADLQQAAETAKAADGTARPVWITEMGWATHVPHNSTTEGFRVTTQRDQACKIARAYIDAIASGVTSNISWYDFRNDGDDPFNFEHNLGIVSQRFELKPAYRAFATVTRLLEGYHVDQELKLDDSVIAYQFARDGGGPVVIVLWDTHGRRSVELAVQGDRAELINLMGETTVLGISQGAVQVPVERDCPVFVIVEGTPRRGGSTVDCSRTAEQSASDWIPLFDGRSLAGWRAAEHPNTWSVDQGQLVAKGPRSHLFYAGPVGNADFRNFELEAEIKTGDQANSGIYFHTEYQETGWPDKGYEVQINNTYPGAGDYRERKKTGSLYGVRDIYKSGVADGEWFRLRVRVVANRIRVWVNDFPTVDYLQPENPPRSREHAGKQLSHGTIALQGRDPASEVTFRSIKIRLLPESADPELRNRASDAGYGIDTRTMDQLSSQSIPFIDFHMHLRGGLTPAKALDRQAVTGILAGVLDNVGKGWTIETDEQLRALLDRVAGMPMYIGMQVNDRDWMRRHSPELIERLDYVLADTMIMPMPTDESEPMKLWLADQYTIDDAEAWMRRYMRHNLRVLAEPITILANPTYLPPSLEDKYDQLWTDERMRQVIQAALANHVALEINASSPWPHERFIRMAKNMGAKFTFGSNNFDDKPINMSRCIEAITRYGLTPDDLYVPEGRIPVAKVATP
jgi:hypothetical protein